MTGAYCLILMLNIPRKIKIGSLGILNFSAGKYVYVGSALNNLEKRIQRHVNKKKKKRWHIDYITTSKDVQVVKALVKESDQRQECEIAQNISNYGIAVSGFGSSDCRCESHFFHIEDETKIDWSGWRILHGYIPPPGKRIPGRADQKRLPKNRVTKT